MNVLIWLQAPGKGKGGADEQAALDDTKFDEFMGNDAGVFAATGEYDDDDKEADAVWEKIDDYMDERRRVSMISISRCTTGAREQSAWFCFCMDCLRTCSPIKGKTEFLVLKNEVVIHGFNVLNVQLTAAPLPLTLRWSVLQQLHALRCFLLGFVVPPPVAVGL